MNFLELILERLGKSSETVLLEEMQAGKLHSLTGREILQKMTAVRRTLQEEGVQPGDRCVLLSPNGVSCACVHLAIIAHGAVCVPMYSRQAPAELAAMVADCQPSLLICSDEGLKEGMQKTGATLPKMILFSQLFREGITGEDPLAAPSAVIRNSSDPVVIIYTSGTSGEPKGVLLHVGNIDHMLGCTSDRLTRLMSGTNCDQERVYHYLPVNYAGSWILMLTSLLRGSRLTFCTDLNRIADDLVFVSPHYFLNVPILLERIRSGIEGKMRKEGGIVAALFQKAQKAWYRREEGKKRTGDGIWFHIADRLIFRAVRKRFGTRLKAIICGSAPLSLETQQFFQMMGISILQVYGLTETTAICTMDDPDHVEMGWVGPAVDGVEMKLGEMDEILVKGPNVFPGYWHRPQATAAAFCDGWFRTGDQGEVNQRGNWRIIGRIKNLLILSSGHNVAPEPMEECLLKSIPGIRQVILIGHGKSFLSALLTGEARTEDIEKAVESINGTLPHYKRIRAYRLLEEPFSIENGLLTANGKLKRDQIQIRWDSRIQEMYSTDSTAH